MSLGGGIDYATTLENAADQFTTGLNQLLKVLADPSLSTLDQDRFIGVMQSLEQTRNRIPLIDHALIGDAEARNLPDALTQPSMIRVLMSVLRLSPGEASRRVRAAGAVGERTSMLGQTLPPLRPHLAAAQQAGRVGPEQVSIIERALAKVDRRGFDPADIDEGERLLVGFADTHAVKDLQMLAEQIVDRIDPDGTLPNDQLNRDRRHVEFHQRGDGSWAGTLRLTGPLGAKLQALLGPLAKPRVNTVKGPGGRLVETPDERHHGQRMHDALEDVCDRLLRSDALPDAGGTPATVIITIDLEDLLAGTGYGITSDGTLISTDQVRPLIDQAEAYYAFLNRNGVVLNLGRTRRIATRSQSAALIARDRGCSFPGCDRAPEWSERHHVIPWIDGGPTDLNNLTLVCVYHHHNFATRGWTCRINADGLPEWHPPRSVDRDQKPLINTRITALHAARTHRRQ
jgi:Domain of unknown function (DUF222)/HNH endonuclease